ncbi:(p)ppGpp synthetase [Acinetobacter sp. BEC1-S18-ESBL-01]|uniref:GTP pyrophosphokinase n=1 Tax=Acinetobacter TaxID=469 RepID=UPI000A331648|nr:MULTISPECIES: (p)ppGpp synthetase [Acinetobacter]MCU4471203.1 (p)ppGpp synthetase [Acinetobacter pittii]MCU4485949.1 (p)ppGpp synthetase [Acinetobacter pittii]MEB3849266.1 (p)ppGpp synthetase [Acinetobacter pittii]OTK28008.1 (p)ppGpp synthetase [Acinetobacter pittii]BBU19993.1 (p)ppGpp synthetase [Acinetobacter sp. BEC1-S18-ESBL-01]
MASLDFEKEKVIFRDYWNENSTLLNQAKNAFIAIINALLIDEFPIAAVSGRVKSREECVKKFSLKYQTVLEEQNTPYEIKDHITDLIGLRIVSLYETDVSKIKDALAKEFEVIEVTDKISAMEAREDSFGYKGLHVDLKLKSPRVEMKEYKRYSNLRFEVQIRTIIQDAWSVLDHKIKYKKSIPISMKRRINTLAALFELADREFYNIKIKTDDQQAEARDKLDQTISITEELDAFTFLAIVEDKFSEFNFQPHKIDGFVAEIVEYSNGTLKIKDFKEIFEKEFNDVEQYKEYLEQEENDPHVINPFTEIRHILYKNDKEKYKKILYKNQRDRFDHWLQERSM